MQRKNVDKYCYLKQPTGLETEMIRETFIVMQLMPRFHAEADKVTHDFTTCLKQVK